MTLAQEPSIAKQGTIILFAPLAALLGCIKKSKIVFSSSSVRKPAATFSKTPWA
jgi:hypothetical protein